MKTLAVSLLFASSIMLGAAANAAGAPASPGGYNHLPRNGVELDNSGHPVTGQGPNAMTRTLQDVLEDAGVPGR